MERFELRERRIAEKRKENENEREKEATAIAQTPVTRLFEWIFANNWSITFFIAALIGVVQTELIPVLLYHPQKNAFFIFCGVVACASTMAFGAYIELYRAVYLRERVSYANARTSTHGMLTSMCLAGISFCIGLWPVWQWHTVPILFMAFWGVIVQIAVLFPIALQRFLFGGGFLLFLFAYLSALIRKH